MSTAWASTIAAQKAIHDNVTAIESSASLIFESGYSWVVIAFEFSMRENESCLETSERIQRDIQERGPAMLVMQLARAVTYFAGSDICPISPEDKTYEVRRITVNEALEKYLEKGFLWSS